MLQNLPIPDIIQSSYVHPPNGTNCNRYQYTAVLPSEHTNKLMTLIINTTA